MTIENEPYYRLDYFRLSNGDIQVNSYFSSPEVASSFSSMLVFDLESFDMKGVSQHAKTLNELRVPVEIFVYDNGKKLLRWVQYEMEI